MFSAHFESGSNLLPSDAAGGLGPEEFVELDLEPGLQMIFEHPSGEIGGADGIMDDREEQSAATFQLAVANKVSRPFVIGAAGDDEF